MNKAAVTSILIAGVGGQGNITASDIIGRTAIASGLEVKIAEVHGMAQRGGSVHSMVRFGHVVHSPLIPRHEADIIVSLEAMEGARWLAYLKPGGLILASTEQRPPLRVLTGEEEYPKDLDSVYRSAGKLYWVDALAIAREAGSAQAANIVMLGALSVFLDFSEEQWLAVIGSRFKPAVAELNRAAFLGGRRVVSSRPRG